ncbi:MAG: FAD:protein FMN transferase [Clostridia bacterium]|nr:FAD:protein FMN transferase [Clostridia bacterium]
MKKIFLLSLILSMLLLNSCQSKNEYTNNFFTMDTPMSITAYGKNAKEGVTKSISYINRLDGLFSKTLNQSEISLANNRDGSAYVFSETVSALIAKSLEYSKATDGAFDITLGTLTNLWDTKSETPKIPSEKDISDALKLTGYKNLIQDKTHVLFKNALKLDMGGVVKGYACDGVYEILSDYGIKSAIVNLGGNIYVIGEKPDKTPWNVGIKDPRNDDQNAIIGYISVKDTSIVTSGDYQRYFIKDGIRYHHIIDPKTGSPSESDLISATIISPSSTMADAFSTAVFIMGREKGEKFLKENNIDYILITKSKEVIVSENLKSSFTFEGKEKGYIYDK